MVRTPAGEPSVAVRRGDDWVPLSHYRQRLPRHWQRRHRQISGHGRRHRSHADL